MHKIRNALHKPTANRVDDPKQREMNLAMQLRRIHKHVNDKDAVPQTNHYEVYRARHERRDRALGEAVVQFQAADALDAAANSDSDSEEMEDATAQASAEKTEEREHAAFNAALVGSVISILFEPRYYTGNVVSLTGSIHAVVFTPLLNPLHQMPEEVTMMMRLNVGERDRVWNLVTASPSLARLRRRESGTEEGAMEASDDAEQLY